MPFNGVLGLKVELVHLDAPQLRFDMRPELIGNPRRQILHGGVIAAVLKRRRRFCGASPGQPQPARQSGERQFPGIGTIDLRVDYLRPGRGHHFVATGRVVRLGNRVAVAHTEMVNDTGELIATGGAAYMVGDALNAPQYLPRLRGRSREAPGGG